MSDREALAAAHPATPHTCPTCEEYRCDGCQVAALLAELDAKDAEVERWKALVRFGANMVDAIDPTDTFGIVQTLRSALKEDNGANA